MVGNTQDKTGDSACTRARKGKLSKKVGPGTRYEFEGPTAAANFEARRKRASSCSLPLLR